MIRVLHIVNLMNRGGIETYIMNVYRSINRNQIQFDFIVNVNERCDYDDEIEALGGKIYHIPRKKDSIIKNLISIYKIVKENNYKVVERHGDNAIMFLDVLAAKIGGAKKVIVHSHNINTSLPKIHKIFYPFLNLLSFQRLACSEDAAKWMFGNKQYILIRNAIDVSKFKYNQEIREDLRRRYNLSGKIVIGHVGRFMSAKNHYFLIEIFRNLYSLNSNCVLMLIGRGELETEIKKKVTDYGLENNVMFMGVRSDVNKLMQAMDCFVLPSLFEGLGIVLIEAQASGLRCFASDTVVPKEAQVTDLLEYIPLSNTPMQWAEKILASLPYNRRDTYTEIKDAGYDIQTLALKLSQIYSEEN
ncbi:MAG TPA: glycosyltransferase family 1 protein [Ignavibacteriales bacterium]|nr:glycosyltransferase family 1 protein [Ignavibacteriales bacterium]